MKICVIGLGKLGLPLAAIFAEAGHEVIGVDMNPEAVECVNQGRSHIVNEPGLPELVEKNVSENRLVATTKYSNCKDSEIFIIAIPLLLGKGNKPDLENLKRTCEDLGKCLKEGDLVVLETTAPPGTTDSFMVPILEKGSGLRSGEDFFIAHSPERISSGQAISDIRYNYPKIVGGVDESSTIMAEELYKTICKEVIVVKDARTAELVKIAEGLYRDVNIALANELALISKKYEIDIWEVIRAANTQPFCNLHNPGPGVGGHCIPVYPWFVINDETKLIRTAREVNDAMPSLVVEKALNTLEEHGKEIVGSNILIAGLVYRAGVKETYHSPASQVIGCLRGLGANVYGHDPVLSEDEMRKRFGVKPHDGKEIDCAIFMHNYDLKVNAKCAVTLHNLFT